ncbi:hypothetical protein QEN19_003339 [Hanseniaspora menglaensis]
MSEVGKTLSSSMSQLLKKSYDLNKLLKQQIRHELQYTNLPYSQKNQFRLLLQPTPKDAHTNIMVLYKKFEDISLGKTYEMFVKTNVSKILHTDYAVEPKKSFESFKKYVKNYYNKDDKIFDSENEFMAIDEQEYEDIKNGKINNENVFKDNTFIDGENESVQDAEMKKRINQLDEFKDENQNMVSFFDEFFNQTPGSKEIENPFDNVYASQFVPLDIIIRDVNNSDQELYIRSLLDLTKVRLFVENVAVLKSPTKDLSESNIIIPAWFTTSTDAETELGKSKHNLGPKFVFFDPTIQSSLYEIFKKWGIVENDAFINDVYEKAEEREQALYISWLFQLKDFFSKQS